MIEHLDNTVPQTAMNFQETERKPKRNHLSVPNLYDTKEYKSSSSETPETGESNLSSPFDNYQFWNCEIVNVTTVKSFVEDIPSPEEAHCDTNEEKMAADSIDSIKEPSSSPCEMMDDTSANQSPTRSCDTKNDICSYKKPFCLSRLCVFFALSRNDSQ